MNIYEIKKEYYDILSNPEFVDLETWEITEAWENALKNNQEAKDVKCENIARYIRNLENENEAYEREVERMANLKKRNSNKINWLKKLLTYALDGQALETELFKFSFRPSESTKLVDKTLLPPRFVTQEVVEKIAWLPDIKKYLKEEVEARFEEAKSDWREVTKDEITKEVYEQYGLEVSFNKNLQIK